jgi:phosphoglycolate phosphatase
MTLVKQHLIFDLDGTLTDPREGIVRSYLYALERLGYTPPPAAEIERHIGPPLRVTLGELLGTTDSERIERAVAVYRERFASVGLFENAVYPDVHAVLESLGRAGYALWVCTSKAHVFARKILAHFELLQFFRGVYGSELDGQRDDKAELLSYLLASESIAAASAVMIGDRRHDIRAARLNHTRSIGVLYGFGDAAELAEAGAGATCARFVELPDTIARVLHGPVTRTV